MTATATTRATILEALDAMRAVPGTPDFDAMGAKALKKAGGAGAALSAYLKTGKRAYADVGAVVDMCRGVGEALAHGQRSRLQGFARACKKETPGFALARALGVVSDTGAVLAGLDTAVSGDKDCMSEYTPAIVGAFLHAQALARKAKADAADTDTDTDTPAAPVEALALPALIDRLSDALTAEGPDAADEALRAIPALHAAANRMVKATKALGDSAIDALVCEVADVQNSLDTAREANAVLAAELAATQEALARATAPKGRAKKAAPEAAMA